MINLGLDSAERAALTAQLATSHRMRVSLRILDHNEVPISSLQAQILSGSVSVDAGADVTRSLDVTLLDPEHKLRFDPASPAAAAIYADNFIAVTRGTYIESLNRWIDVPVFWGPVTGFRRKGAEVVLEAQGKEVLLLDPHHATKGYTLPKGMRLDDVIRNVAARQGETRFNIPDLPTRLTRGRIVEPESEPWKVLRGGDELVHFQQPKGRKKKKKKKAGKPPGGLVGTAEGYDCFYDGLGRLTVRRISRNSIFTFGENHLLTEVPEIIYETGEFGNYVVVHGGRAKGSKRSAWGTASLPPSNPLSPTALARNGKPRYMTMFVEADSLKTAKACRNRAALDLGRFSMEGVSGEFPSLPVPFLEENDAITLRTDDVNITFPLRQFTIPLTHDAAMSVGALINVAVR